MFPERENDEKQPQNDAANSCTPDNITSLKSNLLLRSVCFTQFRRALRFDLRKNFFRCRLKVQLLYCLADTYGAY